MSDIVIYQKTGADYAREISSSYGRAYEAQRGAEVFALRLHVRHLRIEHGLKVNDIAKRVGLKRNQVLEYLK